MTIALAGKNIVITGASSGIGERIAHKVAERGGNLVLLARSTTKIKQLSKELVEKYDVEAIAMTLDVSDMVQVQSVFSEIMHQWDHVDVLINNAGFGIFDLIHEANLEDIQHMFEVNVVGLIACTKMVVPVMLKQQQGHIINIASIAGKVSTPKSTVYSASKHAVLGFSNGLRMELSGTNVHVTTVNPGPINTNFFNIADPKGTYVSQVERFILDPDDVAEKIVSVIGRRKRELNLPRLMGIGATLYQLFPSISERLAGRLFNKK